MINRTNLLLTLFTLLLLECTYASIKTTITSSTYSKECSQKKTQSQTTSISSVSQALNKQTKNKRAVTISNDIVDNKLGYEYFFTTYNPTLFKVTIHGTEIKQGTSQTLQLTDNSLTIVYYCEFKHGKRKSSKKFTYLIKPESTAVSITFDWHHDPRIIVSHAEYIAAETIEV